MYELLLKIDKTSRTVNLLNGIIFENVPQLEMLLYEQMNASSSAFYSMDCSQRQPHTEQSPSTMAMGLLLPSLATDDGDCLHMCAQ